VAGDAESARVREPLPVEDHHVRLRPQLPEGVVQRGKLAKGEVAGDVRHLERGGGARFLHRLQRGGVERHDPRVAALGELLHRHVRAGDGARAEVRRRAQLDALAQGEL
jgi:hypothetical protein